jgi:cation/acetate symporter
MDTIQIGEVGSPEGNMRYDERPEWFRKWETTGLLSAAPDWPPKAEGEPASAAEQRAQVVAFLEANPQARAVFVDAAGNEVTDRICEECKLTFLDKNGDQRLQYYNDDGSFDDEASDYGWNGNELVKVDRDIMVLANPEIAGLPNWVIALVVAGGLAAALSTAAGLLLAISSAISHDLLKGVFMPGISERAELNAGRLSMLLAILVAGYLGLNPPGFAAGTVAIAFGLAASSIFPVLMMGIFNKKMNSAGAIAGMLAGITVTLLYVFQHKGIFFIPGTEFLGSMEPDWFFGISPNAFGAVGALVNFVVAFLVAKVTAAPPEHIQHLVEDVRVPRGAGEATGH